MIVGTGVDIIEISRVRQAVERWGERFLNRVFNPEEIAYARCHAVPYPHYAGRFAAKEAVYKSLGDSRVSWKDLTIVNDPSGQPLCQGAYIPSDKKVHISISHSRYYAVASAIVEA
jgi:holo-[acyl-carrier protein] synthase